MNYEAIVKSLQGLSRTELSSLNNAVIAAMKRADATAAHTFVPGERVTFSARGFKVVGTVRAVNIKTVTVASDPIFAGNQLIRPTQLWRVGGAVLSRVPAVVTGTVEA